MADKKKPRVVEGEVVPDEALTITGHNPSSPELQRLPAERRLREIQAQTPELLKHIDTRDVEMRLLKMYAGQFVGAAYNPDNEKSEPEAMYAPVAGRCHDIDGYTWHRPGDRCEKCGFGVDESPKPSRIILTDKD